MYDEMAPFLEVIQYWIFPTQDEFSLVMNNYVTGASAHISPM